MVNINIQIPDELHKRMKLYCVMKGISLKQFIVDTLSEHVEKTLAKKRGT